jgi:hypothetical protein
MQLYEMNVIGEKERKKFLEKVKHKISRM